VSLVKFEIVNNWGFFPSLILQVVNTTEVMTVTVTAIETTTEDLTMTVDMMTEGPMTIMKVGDNISILVE